VDSIAQYSFSYHLPSRQLVQKTNAAAEEEERCCIIECVKVYRSVPASWGVKSKEYSDRKNRSDAYEVLLRKYRGISMSRERRCQKQKKFSSY
jgi:hypothetical protein